MKWKPVLLSFSLLGVAAMAVAGSVRGQELNWEFGEKEIVYDWSTQRCETEDIPDTPPRAFVDYEGNVVLFASSYLNQRFEGPNLNQMEKKCEKSLKSEGDGTIRNYNDVEWLGAFHTEDGRNVYSLIHTEYHGWEHNNCNSSDLLDCWWNSINLAISRDGGKSFSHSSPPDHNILNPPFDYDINNREGAMGYLEPSNILPKDGYYYAYMVKHFPNEPFGICVMRTNNLQDPDSWRLWDGTGFNARGDGENYPNSNCQSLSPTPVSAHNVVYDEYLGKYISLGCSWGSTCYYNTSDDLIHWSNHRRIEIPGACGYAGLLQPGSNDRNYTTVGRSPWLYLTMSDRCSSDYEGWNRDLYRIRVRLSEAEDVGKNELLDLRFNEWKGRQTLDASFYGNDGFLFEGVSWQREGEVKYLHFDGGGRVEVEDSNSLDIQNQMEIKARIRVNRNTSGNFWTIVKKEREGERNYGLYVSPEGKLHFSFGKDLTYYGSIGSRRVDDGLWHEIQVGYDDGSGVVSYWIDGRADGQVRLGGSLGMGQNAAKLIVGDQGFSGDIDKVTITNYRSDQLMPECQINSNGEVGEDEILSVKFVGDDFSGGNRKVRLFLEKEDGSKITGWSGGSESQHQGKYFYFVGESTANGSWVNKNISGLDKGEYYLHCDIYEDPNKCSGNPFCVHEGGDWDNCSGWRSCSDEDNKLFSVVGSSVPTPTPTIGESALPDCQINIGGNIEEGEALSVRYLGNDYKGGERKVRLFLERSDGGRIEERSGQNEGNNYGHYGYLLGEGQADGQWINLQVEDLSKGDYYLHCDIYQEPDKCSGNPFCPYEGGSASYCDGWRSCSNRDNLEFTVSTATVPTIPPLSQMGECRGGCYSKLENCNANCDIAGGCSVLTGSLLEETCGWPGEYVGYKCCTGGEKVAPTETVSPTPEPVACNECSVDGDVDCDGVVELEDYAIWRDEYDRYRAGGTGGWRSDFNCDRKVDDDDYVIWKKRYINLINLQ